MQEKSWTLIKEITASLTAIIFLAMVWMQFSSVKSTTTTESKAITEAIDKAKGEIISHVDKSIEDVEQRLTTRIDDVERKVEQAAHAR